MSELTVGKLVARPGEKLRGHLEVVNTDLVMPITLINGVACGQTVVITGGVHGGEYPGVETSIRLANQIQPADISGKLIIVHPVNTGSFLARTQYVNPVDGQNLNRMFPGRACGTITERIAYTITTELHAQADFYMDLHGGDIHEALVPFVIYSFEGGDEVTEISKKAASLLGVPYVIGSRGTGGTFGSAAKSGVPGFLGEIGQCGRWSEEEVEQYMRGVKNVLRYLEVLSGEVEDLGTVTYMPRMNGIASQHDGCWYPTIKPGDTVSKGAKVGEVRDFFGNTLSEYYAPVDGIVVYVVSSLAIVEGAPLAAIG